MFRKSGLRHARCGRENNGLDCGPATYGLLAPALLYKYLGGQPCSTDDDLTAIMMVAAFVQSPDLDEAMI